MAVTTPRTISTNTTVDNTYKEIHINASSGAVNALLSATGCDDTQEFFIKCIDLTNAATVSPEVGSINGLPSFSFTYKNESIRLQKRGSSNSWKIIEQQIESETAKIYRALLTQSGTDAPTAIVLENTLGEVPTFTYNTTGSYVLQIVGGLFVDGKTYLDFRSKISNSGNFTDNSAYWFDFQRSNTNNIAIYSTRGDGTTPYDDALLKTELTILIYP